MRFLAFFCSYFSFILNMRKKLPTTFFKERKWMFRVWRLWPGNWSVHICPSAGSWHAGVLCCQSPGIDWLLIYRLTDLYTSALQQDPGMLECYAAKAQVYNGWMHLLVDRRTSCVQYIRHQECCVLFSLILRTSYLYKSLYCLTIGSKFKKNTIRNECNSLKYHS